MESVQVAADNGLRTFAEVRQRAREIGPKRVGVVIADDEVALTAAAEAMRAGIANPVLIGEEKDIRARAEKLGFVDLIAKAEFVHAGHDINAAATLGVAWPAKAKSTFLMKGHLRTDQLFSPVLDKEKGLRTGNLLADAAFFEHQDPAGTRLVCIVDGGLNPGASTLAQKKQIVLSAIEVAARHGNRQPKIAVMSAVEMVSDAIQSTVDAKALTEMGAGRRVWRGGGLRPAGARQRAVRVGRQDQGHHQPGRRPRRLPDRSHHRGGQHAGQVDQFSGRLRIRPRGGGRQGTDPDPVPRRKERQDKINAMALGVLYASR